MLWIYENEEYSLTHFDEVYLARASVMYGNLQEFDVSSLLSFICEQQKSGTIFIEDELSLLPQKKRHYFLFFHCGRIIFAADNLSFSTQRINDYLTLTPAYSESKNFFSRLNHTASLSEYEAILLLANQQILSVQQQRYLCQAIIQEILLQIVALKQGSFIWQDSFKLQPIIISFNVHQITSQVQQTAIAWQKFFPYIQHIEQLPVFTSEAKKSSCVGQIDEQVLTKMDGKTSFIQLSRYFFNPSLIELTSSIYPYVKQGLIQVINPASAQYLSADLELGKSSQVVFFSTIGKLTINTDNFIGSENYNCLLPGDFNQFLTCIFNLPIALIIIESGLNHANTYNLCQIIRNNKKTSSIPIILVAEKYIFQEHLTAKIHGVTEYISQSNFNNKTAQILDKYLGN